MRSDGPGTDEKGDISVIGHFKLTPMVVVFLAFFAAIGMAVKQIVHPITAFALAPFLLPVAPFVSGAYMLWLSAGRAVTGYRLAGTFMGSVQAFISFLMVFGRHGAFSIPLYMITGICIDLVFLVMSKWSRTLPGICIATAAASVVGALMVTGIELQMGDAILYASALIAAASGLIGGIAAHKLVMIYDRTMGRRISMVPEFKITVKDQSRG